MYDLVIDNSQNDERVPVKTPIIPNIGDFIVYDSEIEEGTTEGVIYMRDFVFKEGALEYIKVTISPEE